MVPDKVKAVSFRRDVILVSRFSEAPEEGIATKDILCLVENTSVRVVQEFLEIEEKTFFDQQAFKADFLSLQKPLAASWQVLDGSRNNFLSSYEYDKFINMGLAGLSNRDS